MSETLNAQDLRLLIQRVFQPSAPDQGLAIIVDLPDDRLADNPDWARRRDMAANWYRELRGEMGALGLKRLTLLVPQCGRQQRRSAPNLRARRWPDGFWPCRRTYG